ncbi:hypothetical protein [Bacillus carboniphilus]|uniref:hypothetical protein n=1 Tax=Bacillus carboniphilus TaxID=86663 RepID=UPI0031D86496
MNYSFLVVAYVASFICSSIGSRLSSLYRIRNVTDIEPILVQSVHTLFDGNKETYMLICAIIITLSGLLISLLAVHEILREMSFRNILASSFLLIIHSINIIICVYFLLFFIILLVCLGIIIGITWIIIRKNGSGGYVPMRGRFRKGSYVRRHPRRRPRRRF